MRIRLLILTLLIIGVHQHIQAQYMLGTIGMINIPTADRQKPGTVMLGGNYLPKQMMPARFDYINPEKPDVPLNKNDAFQKVQKRHVQEKR